MYPFVLLELFLYVALFRFFLYLVIIFSAVLHEYFHSWTANYLGDPTAKYAGRLTLNPIKHLDLVGTVILPLLLLFFFGGFLGWAKPVPYNPFNLRDPRYGPLKVAIAGPVANMLIAVVFGLALRFFVPVDFLYLYIALSWVVYINIFLAFFNLIPVPPLDGSKLLMYLYPKPPAFFRAFEAAPWGFFLALLLALNFLPAFASAIYFFITGSPFLGLMF